MIQTVLIGAGKMGLSHLSILGAHPDVNVIGVADTSGLISDVLKQFTSFKIYTDYKLMLQELKPDAAIVSVPTKYHSTIVDEILKSDMHVFVEKPFCMKYSDAIILTELANKKKLVNQVGYHNRFIGTFREVKRVVDSGSLGHIYHFTGEAYGPVVIRNKQRTWRSELEQGGGCLMDYASHVIDLIHYVLSPIDKIIGSLVKTVFSKQVDDSVYALVKTNDNTSGVISVNWSDMTFRKMSTSITINGKNGKIVSDASELKIYFEEEPLLDGYTKGWNIKHITELTKPVDFYLRGEEYSLQLDHFIDNIQGKIKNNINSFISAAQTDKVIDLIKSAKD